MGLKVKLTYHPTGFEITPGHYYDGDSYWLAETWLWPFRLKHVDAVSRSKERAIEYLKSAVAQRQSPAPKCVVEWIEVCDKCGKVIE